MARVLWKKEYSVGINSIDMQHKHLFESINSFYDNIEKKKNTDALLIILDELKKYAVYHFDTEEALMKQYDFQGLNHHVREHNKFKNEIEDFEKKVLEGKLLLSLSITGFLEKWIRNHVLTTDQHYKEFLISKGVR